MLILFQEDRIITADVEGRGVVKITEFEDRQRLKQLEDQVLDLLLVLESTLDVINALINCYKSFQSLQIEKAAQNPSVDVTLCEFQERLNDVNLYVKRAQLLLSKISGTSQLVMKSLLLRRCCISSMLTSVSR